MPRLDKRVSVLERLASTSRIPTAADLEAANTALAQGHGLTVADAIARHGSWGAFCWWAMCQTADEVSEPDDGLSAHERYRLMCAAG